MTLWQKLTPSDRWNTIRQHLLNAVRLIENNRQEISDRQAVLEARLQALEAEAQIKSRSSEGTQP